MIVLIRHLFAIATLPFVMAVLVPIWLARQNELSLAPATTPPLIAVQILGLLFLSIGLALFVSSLRRFAGDGKGTLAPWDPPRQLVVTGPYRFVRNPMISGVLFVVIGEACVLLSSSHLIWAFTFFVINAVYIPLLEEPQLMDRFGSSYAEYSRHVPRLVPRLRPWTPAAPEANRSV